MDTAGQVVAAGPVVGCVVLLVGSDARILDIRQEAALVRCEASLATECPFAQREMWFNCPRFTRPWPSE